MSWPMSASSHELWPFMLLSALVLVGSVGVERHKRGQTMTSEGKEQLALCHSQKSEFCR